MKSAIFKSSLGKKYVMAITGFLLFVFVILHMLGNLQVFLGPEQLNRYGDFLQSAPELVWASRLGLLAAVLLHIVSAVLLTRENRAARPAAYLAPRYYGASYASRTMLMSGLILFIFIVYHLLHFTVQVDAINLTGESFVELHDEKGRHDVYRMVVVGFSNFWVSAFYIVGMGLLALHLSHGASSMFQSMGWKNKKFGIWLDRLALAAAVALFVGYSSIPIAVLTGILKTN